MKRSLNFRPLFIGLWLVSAGSLVNSASGEDPTPPPSAPAVAPDAITFLPGAANSPIAAGVAVPAGQALFLTSGTVPPVLDDKAAAGSPVRYGDTETQGAGALRQIEIQLKKVGLSLKDVIYLRVYLAADKTKDGRFDYPGWFQAYGQFFGTPENPVKPARSTVGVASLVNPDWLIEIEAVAAYPKKEPATPAK
jgi:enamine deaminase RidA (YjgF/YER057c/UK114 family)